MLKKTISDHDPRFMSDIQTTLRAKLGTKVGLYHLKIDGQSERFYRSLEKILHCIITLSKNVWDNVLEKVEFALSVTIHSAHDQSSFRVVYGWEPSLPIDHAFPNLYNCKVYAVTKLIQAYH